jgi:hypothetical protein
VSTLLILSSCSDSDDFAQDPDETIVYFLVTEIPGYGFHEDSYVIGIRDVVDIEYARSLISANGVSQGRGTIIVCEIAAGSDGINRDLLSDGNPLWSWHVLEFADFADVTAEILDGWPSYKSITRNVSWMEVLSKRPKKTWHGVNHIINVWENVLYFF